MITGMTAALEAALSGKARSPRQLLEINFPNSGTVYISDQRLGAADGLANEYLPLVEDWGSLPFAVGDAMVRDHGLIRQCSITFWNGGSTQGPISNAWKVRGWPTIYVLDAEGVIRYRNVRGHAMDQAVDTLLAEMEAKKK